MAGDALRLSNRFYSLIPHISYSEGGGTRGRLPLIDTPRLLQSKVRRRATAMLVDCHIRSAGGAYCYCSSCTCTCGAHTPVVLKMRILISTCRLPLATASLWQVEMVEALGNIQLAGRALADPSDAPTLHPVDARYAELRTQLTPIDRNSSMHQLLQEYLRNTHGATHSSYSLQLEQAFEVAREGEADAFR